MSTNKTTCNENRLKTLFMYLASREFSKLMGIQKSVNQFHRLQAECADKYVTKVVFLIGKTGLIKIFIEIHTQ